MDNEKKLDIDWADLIDLLASEYGWTIDYIKGLNMGQVVSLIKAIKKRYLRQNSKNDNENNYPEVLENINEDQSETLVSDFIKMGGKIVEKDGKKQIII